MDVNHLDIMLLLFALCRLDPVNNNVYVGNIAPEWPEAEIQAHFASKLLHWKPLPPHC